MAIIFGVDLPGLNATGTGADDGLPVDRRGLFDPLPQPAPTGNGPEVLPDYEEIGRAVGQLVTEKQRAYGDSFGKSGAVLRLLYPGGISPDQLDDMLTVVRVVDKLFRIATDRDALGESPWRDVAGYAVLAHARVQAKKGVL